MQINYTKNIHNKFEEIVKKYPEKTAVVFKEKSLTYRELNIKSNIIADHLINNEKLFGKKIVIFLDRSEIIVASMLGVLKSGNYYIPLDPSHPRDRINMILADVEPDLIITQEKFIDEFSDDIVIYLPSDILPNIDIENPVLDISIDSLAYIIFTSGSTGKPKGVMVPRKSMNNAVYSYALRPGIISDDVLLAVATVSFDVSVLDIYLPLTNGATLVIMSQEGTRDPFLMNDELNRMKCTIMQATPATWQMLIDSGWQGSNILKILCGGEAMRRDLAENLIKRSNELWNMYGPTETTVWASMETVRLERKISIGEPIHNSELLILDKKLNIVSKGQEGELYIGGAGLTDGYFGQPELTNSVFIQHPFKAGERVYKTGDLVRVMEDDRLEYLGRSDFQVKIRGFRIELGEIESTLIKMEEVKSVVVHTQKIHGFQNSLVAYIVPSKKEFEHIKIRDFLSLTLPDYMIPEYSVFMEDFPINQNGKIDRKKLPVPVVLEKEICGEKNPQDLPLQERVLWVWKSVLQLNMIELSDDFFNIGGNSILAVQLMTKINELCNTNISLGSFFKQPTINGLLSVMNGEGEAESATVIPLKSSGNKPPLFCIAGITLYSDLANTLESNRPVYGVYIPYEQKIIEYIQENTIENCPYLTINDMAKLYIEEIKEIQPKGPYNLLGLSMGGMIAYEMASILQKAGEEVNSVFLLDSHLPSSVKKNILFFVVKPVKFIKGKIKSILNSINKTNKSSMSIDDIELLRDKINEMATNEFDNKKLIYDGNVCLIRATDNDYPIGETYPEHLGWQGMVNGKLDVFICEGSHVGIIDAKNVERVSEIVRAKIIENEG